jgi:hypothetical protein
MTTEVEFNRFSIALFDFEKAVAYAEEALKTSPGTLAYEALMFAAVVCYYRPFTPNEKNKTPPAAIQLKVEDFSPFSEDERKIHEQCKALRNKALAHSEWTYNPTRFDHRSGVISSHPFALVSHAPDLRALIQLSKRLANKCHSKRADYVRHNATAEG